MSGCAPEWATCRKAERYFRGLPSRKIWRWASLHGRAARVFQSGSSKCFRCCAACCGGAAAICRAGNSNSSPSVARSRSVRRLLILDEPTEGIQPSIIKDIERAIRTLAESGEMAILLVEQYYDFARSLADQYLVMERGEIIARGAGADMDRTT